MASEIKKWSELNNEDKKVWLDAARRNIYIALEPTDPQKEAAIPALARKLFYDKI